MSIPKRVDAILSESGLLRTLSVSELLAHERAVAKRAVEALQTIWDCSDGRDDCDVISYEEICEEANEALKEIKASGWRP